MLKYIHEFTQSRDAHFTVPTYNFMNHFMNFDFIFKVSIPEPNKDRMIVERGARGRIMKSCICKCD